jgi:hypothetical protein
MSICGSPGRYRPQGMDVMGGEVVKALGRRDLPYTGGVEFVSLCRHMLIGKGSPSEAHASAEADPATPRRVVEALKAAVTAGSLADPTWAGALGNPVRPIVAAYIESLASISFFDFAWTNNAFVRVEEAGQKVVITTTSATGSTVAELAPTPLSQMAFAAPAVSLRKTITECVLSNEVVRDPNNARHIGRELQSAVARAVDVSALATIIAAGTSNVSIGNSVANLVTDIQAMFNSIAVGEQSRLFFILNSALATSLSARLAGSVGWRMTPRGGELAGVETIVSSGAPTGNLILVDCSRFAAFNSGFTLAASQEATTQMSSTPDSPPVPSTVTVSLFQHNLTSLKATRYWGLQALTSNASATTTGMV